MKQCPSCKYEAGLDPENNYEMKGDKEFIQIQQGFVVKKDIGDSLDSRVIYLDICPKCGTVFYSDVWVL